jgi:DnaK suppressor protein
VKAAPAPQKIAAKTAPKSTGAKLVVLEAEDPWTKEELNEVRTQLRSDIKRLRSELEEVAGDLADLMRDAGESAGSDQADVGSATFERDQEMTIVNNARDMLMQSEHALERIADGTYGVCEMCGNPIGKNRLMVFPRATMCMTCKQREERR